MGNALKRISVVTNARLQSTRVPRKLVRPFADTTLIEIALAKLNRMDFFEHRYLAVAEPELKRLASDYPAVDVLDRAPEAVQQGVNPQRVTFAHYLHVPSDYIFVFNPCLPCITVETIRRAYDYCQSTDHPSYTAVVPTGDWVFGPNGDPVTNTDPGNPTTNLDRSFRKATHAFHIVRKQTFAEHSRFWTFTRDDPHLVPMPEEEAVDIDTEIEFAFAEMLWQRSRARRVS